MAGTVVPADYGFVILAASALGFQVLYHGARYAGGARRRFFGKTFWEQPEAKALLDEEKKITGKDKNRGGYPDMGNGRYAALLSHNDWLSFNFAQRAHLNYVEGIGSTLAFTLLGGIVYPRFCAATAAFYAVGREIYAAGYAKKGPAGRMAGAIVFDLALVALFGASLAAGWKIADVSKLLGF